MSKLCLFVQRDKNILIYYMLLNRFDIDNLHNYNNDALFTINTPPDST